MRFSVIFVVVSLLSAINGYRILVLLPFPGPSHFMMFKIFIKELIIRGHEITAITAYPLKERIENYTEIVIDPPWSPGKHFTQEQIFDMKFVDQIEMLMMYWWLGIDSTRHCLENPLVKNFTLHDNSHFDLILTEQFFQEALLMFAHKYKAPIVSLSTYGYSDFFDRIMGSITPYSFIPHMVLSDYNDNMNFFQRLHNFIFSMADVVIREYYYMPAMNRMAHKYFSQVSNLPTIRELEKSISIILVNNHVAMFKPRPSMPGIIDVGGAHMQPLKPLPHRVKKFLDEAKHGVIYMSLGSYVQSSNMPKDKLRMLIKVFGSMKQRVLWKYEKDDLENLPENLMISKWMPQVEILNHPKVVLFISHGGLFGTIEASHFGVPILFMPFFGDQYRNAKMVKTRGYGQYVLFSHLTEDLIKSKINEIIENKTYHQKAKEMSAILRDNPVNPLNLSMYWIEYAVKHKGAKHLKSHAIELNWYQYLMLDVLFTILLASWIFYKAIKMILIKMFANDSYKKKIE